MPTASYETSQEGIEEEERMNERYLKMDRSRSVESVRLLRLRGLLRDEVRREGPMSTAVRLGVNYKTIARALESGNLTPHLAEALELLLICGGTPAMVRLRERIDVMEERVDALDGKVDDLASAATDAIPDGREPAKEAEERKPAADDLTKVEPEAANAVNAAHGGALDTLVVSEVAEPGEEDAYGPAWPLIVEWRWLRDGHPDRGRSLSWLETEERLLLLELAMLEEYGLTLPPETEPLRGFGRYGQINWRRTALEDTRRASVRRRWLRWLRRCLTLGLWWK